MKKFNELLAKAKAKGYKTFHDDRDHSYLEARVTECMYIYAWLHVVYDITLPIVFIEGIEPEKQIDMLEEVIDNLD